MVTGEHTKLTLFKSFDPIFSPYSALFHSSPVFAGHILQKILMKNNKAYHGELGSFRWWQLIQTTPASIAAATRWALDRSVVHTLAPSANATLKERSGHGTQDIAYHICSCSRGVPLLYHSRQQSISCGKRTAISWGV